MSTYEHVITNTLQISIVTFYKTCKYKQTCYMVCRILLKHIFKYLEIYAVTYLLPTGNHLREIIVNKTQFKSRDIALTKKFSL